MMVSLTGLRDKMAKITKENQQLRLKQDELQVTLSLPQFI